MAQKLGVKAGHRLHTVNAPKEFPEWLEPLPPDVRWRPQLRAPLDVIVAFFTTRVEVERRVDRLAAALAPDGGLWVAWPKKASGVATDLTEQTFRDLLLPAGRLVDNKVAAISDVWSGLRFVIRKELRR